MRKNSITFRSQVIETDPDTIENIIRSSGFFYEEEIPIARELAEESLKYGEASGYQFVFAMAGNEVLGYAAFGFIDGTDCSYDLYWIAVSNEFRGMGIGKALLEQVIIVLNRNNGRQLIAETSSLEKYVPTHAFYTHNAFDMVATIPDFFRIGDDKVFFVRKL